MLATPAGRLLSGSMRSQIRRGLVSYWPCDEASGPRRDNFGANHLTDNNAASGATGPGGQLPLATQVAAASTQYLSVADSPSVSMGAGIRMTLCAWCYLDSEPSDGSIACHFNGSTNQRGYMLRYNSGDDRFRLHYSDNGSNNNVLNATTFGPVSTATWYFLCGRYDGGKVYVSVNGGAEDSAVFTAGIHDASAAFTIGAADGTNGPFDGRIAGVGLWKRSLSPREISWLYNNGSPRRPV